mmetsp:Transcript_20088/g.51314  ORF Transcript_20088/g.51314 Transcript_20088/m.51314 type:complete len:429 (+) Transcript_20088:336-1622(+)
MRGPPGSGKSTAARFLLAQHMKLQGVDWRPGSNAAFVSISRAFILSTDDFFTKVDDRGKAEYHFNPSKLKEYHPKNQARCEASMELGLTPLFVDNTNISLWEMRDYLKAAEKFGYDVQVVDPQALGPGALDPAVLESRIGEGAEGRASGKEIPGHVLKRMVSNFEDLPPGLGSGSGPEAYAALGIVREARAPWERPPGPPVPSYAGLDVEARALARLGALELGPLFWEDQACGEGEGLESNLLDARCKDGADWSLPDRLHVTVRFFGRDPVTDTIAAAEALVGSWFEVEARSLVFVRGGGLLCADVGIVGPGAEDLAGLVGEDWLPHITLLNAKPWWPKDSNDLLSALKKASKEHARSTAAAAAGGEDEEVIDLAGEEDVLAGPTSEEDPRAFLFPGLQVRGRAADVCVLPLDPPQPLGPCKFKLFFP